MIKNILCSLNYKYKLCFSGCRLQYTQCPSDTDLLLNYFNNHNGGLFQNTLPSVTNEVPTYKYVHDVMGVDIFTILTMCRLEPSSPG